MSEAIELGVFSAKPGVKDTELVPGELQFARHTATPGGK